ncbi:unnamed protein product [Trifolium pratense]|uniref:Uncharacterized protein n=1 Tax=Trifolium pratense TaxID=57577 RepID=A0ACB0IMT7_TRIPR|nr:unnamed protein product [Trifolium pratense]
MAAAFHFSTTQKSSTSPFLLGGFKPHSFTFPMKVCLKPKPEKMNLKPISAASSNFHSKKFQESFFKTVERSKKAVSENPLYQSMVEEEEMLKLKLQQINEEKINLEEKLQNLIIKKDEFVRETLVQTFAVAIMMGEFGGMKIRYWKGAVTDGLSETISKIREKQGIIEDDEDGGINNDSQYDDIGDELEEDDIGDEEDDEDDDEFDDFK